MRSTATPLYIMGCPRSGTSLLRDMINLCSDVYICKDEFQVWSGFNKFCVGSKEKNEIVGFLNRTNFSTHMRREGLWPNDARLQEIVDPEYPGKTLHELMVELAQNDAVPRPAYVGDKTPENIFCVDSIMAALPSVRLLLIERDPRDVVASMNRAWGRSIDRGSHIWLRASSKVSGLVGDLDASKVFYLTYEDLCAHPTKCVEQIANWLGTKFDPDGLNEFRTREQWGAASGASGIISNCGNWKSQLTASEAVRIEQICFSSMIRSGYQPTLAERQIELGPLRLKVLRFVDGSRSLLKYVKYKGLGPGLLYKIRQWRNKEA